MKIKSYNIEMTEAEITAIHKVLGRFTDIELEAKGIVDDQRELLRDVYDLLCGIADLHDEKIERS